MNTAVTITTTTRTGSTERMRTQSGLCANKGLLGHLCNLALDDELLQPRLGPLAQLQLLQHLNRRVALQDTATDRREDATQRERTRVSGRAILGNAAKGGKGRLEVVVLTVPLSGCHGRLRSILFSLDTSRFVSRFIPFSSSRPQPSTSFTTSASPTRRIASASSLRSQQPDIFDRCEKTSALDRN